MPKFKLKKGDKVIVTTGRDKGKTGEIVKILTDDSKVIVKGVNVLTKHVKPSAAGPGGLTKVESPIHISNVALADPKTGKPTRVGYKTSAKGKARVAKRSGQEIS